MKKRKAYYRHPRLLERPLILYPAGEYGRRMLKELRGLGVEPAAFCDGNAEKIGRKIGWGGVNVRSLESLVEQYGTHGALYLVNSSYNFPQIRARLRSFGIPEDKILSPDFYAYCDTGKSPRPLAVEEEDRKRMKACLMELLLFFHSVCVKYSIPYYITSGTLLGAVRHGGFIPWDDDIDVAMFRKDYNRFYRVVKKELGDTYAIQELPSRKNLALKNSVCRLFGEKYDARIMLDTLPVDFVFAYPNAVNLLQEKVSLCFFRWAQKCRWYDQKGMIRWLGRGFRGLGIGVEQLCNPLHPKWTHFFIYDTPNLSERRVYHQDLIGNRTLLAFEGHSFYGPEQYERLLDQMFGERWRELPPPEQRLFSHMISELRFPERRNGSDE